MESRGVAEVSPNDTSEGVGFEKCHVTFLAKIDFFHSFKDNSSQYWAFKMSTIICHVTSRMEGGGGGGGPRLCHQ